MLKLSLKNDLQILEWSNTHPYVKKLNSIDKQWIDAVKERRPNNSVYSQSRRGWIYSNVYLFDDEVTRVVVWGNATYYIIKDDTVQIVECSAGDQITIPPMIPHWFSGEGEITILRFFATEDGHNKFATGITDEIKEAHRKLKHKMDITI